MRLLNVYKMEPQYPDQNERYRYKLDEQQSSNFKPIIKMANVYRYCDNLILHTFG